MPLSREDVIRINKELDGCFCDSDGGTECNKCKFLRDELKRYELQKGIDVVVPINSTQVGGDHYKTDGEQHWDRMWRMYREAWFVGNITKYVERYRKKDGIKDLEKAAHYLKKLIELETEDLKQRSNNEPE